jgi:hypothetical protein
MADRNERREPRWNNSGYWIERDDDDSREGDYELSRSYDRGDMRRYARQSQEQGERLRSMRSQGGYNQRDYRHTGGDRGTDAGGGYRERQGYGARYGYGGAEWANRGVYNSEMARGRGFDRYRRGEQDAFRSRGDRYRTSEGRYGSAGDRFRSAGDRYGSTGDRYGSTGDRYRGWEDDFRDRDGEMGNFWGERQRRQQYGQGRRGRDYVQGRDFDYQIEGGWDEGELDREFDLDPGFSYEYGTDFSALDQPGYGDQQRGRQQENQGWGRHRSQWDTPGQFAGVGPRGYQRSRERISEDIHERLRQHGQLDARQIHVEVEDSQVTLSGSAGSKQEKYLAEFLAETVSGVREVNNQIRVRDTENVRVRGMEREDVVMLGRIHEGMRVAGVDGKHIGVVQKVRRQGFTLERQDSHDTYIPFRAVKRTNGQIILHVAGNEIDRQGWREF